MEQDAPVYLSAARPLAHGRGYEDFTGGALTNFPPLFPAAIRAGMGSINTKSRGRSARC